MKRSKAYRAATDKIEAGKVYSPLEAVRLARYPGAGNRNPKRMALGLCENLSVLKTHLSKSIGALEAIANGAAPK